MDAEEDTPLLEIPVHVSKRLSDKLYVFQYLDKFPDVKLSNTVIDHCAIKPQNREVKLDLTLNTDSVNYDAHKGEDIAVNCDGIFETREKNKDPMFNSEVMNKNRYASSVALDDSMSYAVGVVNQGGIHLTPMKGIIQLRPALEYIDRSDKKQKSKKNSDGNEIEDKNEATPVTVRFARRETERMKKIKEQSFAYFSRKVAEEPWCQTTWHNTNSIKSQVERLNLISAENQDVGHKLALPHTEYIKCLVPPPVDSHRASSSSTENKTASLVDRCKALLKDAKIITFDELCSLLGNEEHSKTDVLHAIVQAAVLVQGLWVVQSELIYPAEKIPDKSGELAKHFSDKSESDKKAVKYVSDKSGVPAKNMCTARDYVLYRFTQSEYVNRTDIAASVKVPDEELKEILSAIGKRHGKKGWSLLLPRDDGFIEKYPDVVKRQNIWWESKAKGKQFVVNQNSGLSKEINKSPRKRKLSNRDTSSELKVNGVHKRDSSVNVDSESGTDKKKKYSIKRKTVNIRPFKNEETVSM